jgi:predicted LPLAT superfamily acyltransferase
MSESWKKLNVVSTSFWLVAIRSIALILGRPVARFLLRPIVAFYYLFTPHGKRDSSNFLHRALNRPVRRRDIFKHLFTFASTILDRVFMLQAKTDQFSLEVEGRELVMDRLKENKGCILMGSHLGSFEVLRCLADSVDHLSLKMLMDAGASEKFNRHLYAINPDITLSIIDSTKPDCVFEVDEAIKTGHIVGILGDRVMTKERSIQCNFLGHKADFPTGPMLMASILKVPVVLFFGVYLGGNRYRIIFEVFTDCVETKRDQRDQDIEMWVKRYVDRLAYYAKRYPYNWFNFYDFWGETNEH